MLINTFLDTEDFVHLYYAEDEPGAQGCGAGARKASKYPRPPSPDYNQEASTSNMTDRERYRSPPQPEPPPHRVRAADLYPRLRTHYDEPVIDVGFTPICGEFVQWAGRTADGGTIAMSNYRLHVQPRRRSGPGNSVPLRIIENAEMRDIVHLVVQCKHGRVVKCTFNTGEQCLEWHRRIVSAIAPMTSVQESFAAAYAAWAKEQPPASVHRALMKASHAAQRHWFGPEVERLGFTVKGAWRVTAVNADYKLCTSYPPLLVVPASICDQDLDAVARFRSMRRIPAVVWRHRGNGAIIARSSQPEVGWLGWRSSEDERLLSAFVTACNADRGLAGTTNKQVKLLIVDARSYTSAVTNRARGGGCECPQYYPNADIQFMSLPNIHHVRKSFQQIRTLAAEPSDLNNWHSNLERTLWLQYLSGACRAACVVSSAVLAGRPVLVHCSDGWDRTPQIVAAAQLLLDPAYRTREGFRTLIEREWLDFGHKFADRCGHQFGPVDFNEYSPIFLQWLDLVHQIMLQYPCSFEFNDAYLIKLATHVTSCMFGTFLCNTTLERIESRVPDTTAQIWHLLDAPAYRNHLYSPMHVEQVLWPEYSVRAMQPWWSLFCGDREEPDDEPVDVPAIIRPSPANGLMTKTRSCDNLLAEGEKRSTQRRCSDPSIAPDVMKLSMVVGPECRAAALTDSCVDELPALPRHTPHDQVSGLHPDHFDNHIPRDIASNSSSLERELIVAAEDKVDHDDIADHSDDIVNHSDDIDDPVVDIDDPIVDIVDHAVDRVIDHNIDRVIEHSAERVDHNITVNGLRDGTPELEVGTPDEATDFVVDTFDGMPENLRETARQRNISITWRSVSESSNQSLSGFDLTDGPRADAPPPAAAPPTPLVNVNSTEGDLTNHNVVQMTNHNRGSGVVNGCNGVDDLSAKFLEVDVHSVGTSSSVSSESETESRAPSRRPAPPRARQPSQLTLCPSPRRACLCAAPLSPVPRRTSATSGIETSGESGTSSDYWCGSSGDGRVWCVCGRGGGGGAGADPLDGLPPAADPLQARLHQIILCQKKVVEELSVQLRSAREQLRRASTPPRSPDPAPSLPPLTHTQAASRSHSGSSSNSGSEIEVGEEASGVVWLPDSAVSCCQHCSNHFWLARRRHHCRRCGGIFCGSCSELSPWGSCGSVRVCRRCRSQR